MISAGDGRFPETFSLNDFKTAFLWIASNVSDRRGACVKESNWFTPRQVSPNGRSVGGVGIPPGRRMEGGIRTLETPWDLPPNA